MVFLLMSGHSLKADEDLGGDQEFKSLLDSTKNPFDDGLPKPVVVPKPIYHPAQSTPVAPPKPMPMPKPVPRPVILPSMKLDGVMVGEDMHEAIINGRMVSLYGTVEGARVESVTKQGVELRYMGKRFFLRVD